MVVTVFLCLLQERDPDRPPARSSVREAPERLDSRPHSALLDRQTVQPAASGRPSLVRERRAALLVLARTADGAAWRHPGTRPLRQLRRDLPHTAESVHHHRRLLVSLLSVCVVTAFSFEQRFETETVFFLYNFVKIMIYGLVLVKTYL